MKLKLHDVWNICMILEITKQRGAAMPDSAKWWLARLARKLKPEFQALNAQRDEMIKSYGKLNKEGQFCITPDVNDDFSKRWNDLTNGEVEVAVDPRPLSFFRFAEVDATKSDGPLSVAEMVALEPLIVEEGNVGQITH